jgi:cytochrome c oxidase subunit 4
MSHPPDRPPHPGAADSAPPEPLHATVATYIKVAVVLTAITAIEVVAIYIRALTPILIPTLLVLSLAKFALVVLFFMHLRYDSRALSVVFVGPLLIAVAIILALVALIGAAMGAG